MRRHASTRTLRERGAAAVELALIMPLLLLFIAGIVDFGRFFLTEIQLTNGAREGARVAVVGTAAGDVKTRVTNAAPVVKPENIAVVACPSGDGNAKVTVTDPTFEWILLEPAMNMFGGAGALPTARAEAVMRCGG